MCLSETDLCTGGREILAGLKMGIVLVRDALVVAGWALAEYVPDLVENDGLLLALENGAGLEADTENAIIVNSSDTVK